MAVHRFCLRSFLTYALIRLDGNAIRIYLFIDGSTSRDRCSCMQKCINIPARVSRPPGPLAPGPWPLATGAYWSNADNDQMVAKRLWVSSNGMHRIRFFLFTDVFWNILQWQHYADAIEILYQKHLLKYRLGGQSFQTLCFRKSNIPQYCCMISCYFWTLAFFKFNRIFHHNNKSFTSKLKSSCAETIFHVLFNVFLHIKNNCFP